MCEENVFLVMSVCVYNIISTNFNLFQAVCLHNAVIICSSFNKVEKNKKHFDRKEFVTIIHLRCEIMKQWTGIDYPNNHLTITFLVSDSPDIDIALNAMSMQIQASGIPIFSE